MRPPGDSRPLQDADGRGLRPVPHNFEAEQALLGTLLAANRVYDQVAHLVTPADFFDPAHSILFEKIGQFVADGQLADFVTLKAAVEGHPHFDDLGGAQSYMANLAACAITTVNAPHYARVIADAARARRLRAIADEMAARTTGEDNEGLISWVESEFLALDANRPDRRSQPLTPGVDQAIETAEQAHRMGDGVSGLATGLGDLDRLLGGLHPGNLVVLAGRPGMGKSAIAFGIAAIVAAREPIVLAGESNRAHPPRVLIFSLEMSRSEIASRLISATGRISASAIRKGQADLAAVIETGCKMKAVFCDRMLINEAPAPTMADIHTEARRVSRGGPIALIVIDHMQLIAGSSHSGYRNRTEDLTEISAACKALAKDLNVPVLALSQLNRGVESRDDKRPMLADLRESGSIEQDADVVIFAFRQSYYLERSEPQRSEKEKDVEFRARLDRWRKSMAAHEGRCQLIIAKNRHGPVGSVFIRFDPETLTVEDLPPGGSPPEE